MQQAPQAWLLLVEAELVQALHSAAEAAAASDMGRTSNDFLLNSLVVLDLSL